MCGRFVLIPGRDGAEDELADLIEPFGARPANDLPDLPNYNICPTDQICVVTSQNGVRHFSSMRWGFIPHWYKTPGGGPLLINARSETIANRPAFGEAARLRRCLIPATGFYEWQKDGSGRRLPWYIRPADQGLLVFAGVWQQWERNGQAVTTCAIVTTQAGPTMSGIHHREPVTLAPQHWGLWLGEEGKGAARLMCAAPGGILSCHRVGVEVNSNRTTGPNLIVPVNG